MQSEKTILIDASFEIVYERYRLSRFEKDEAKGFGCDYTFEYGYRLPDELFQDREEKQKFEDQLDKDLEQALEKLKGLCEALN